MKATIQLSGFIQATIVDNLDNAANASLMKFRCRSSGQGAITEEECAIVGSLSKQTVSNSIHTHRPVDISRLHLRCFADRERPYTD